MNWLVKKWYSSDPICYLFTPLSAIYRATISFRQFLYHLGFKKVTRFPVPIVVVGNITVGGTGKTPLVIWLANYLREQGYQPGIVSRGYGGNAKQYPQLVTRQSDSAIAGDEALLIAEKTDCPVVVDPQRVNAVKLLLEKHHCNIIISDDGLQHYALGRDLEIAVVDSSRGFGNQFCLPAGPLREPLKRLSKVNFIVSNEPSSVIPRHKLVIPRLDRGIHPDCHASEGWHPELTLPGACPVAAAPYFAAQNKESACAPPALVSMQFIPGQIYNVSQPNLTLSSEQIKNHKIHAVAGIGNPQRFFNSLRELGFSIVEHPFPDHYAYKKQDLEFGENTLIIMTEKDAVKCKQFADQRHWCLPISASLPADFLEAILLSLRGNSRSDPGF